MKIDLAKFTHTLPYATEAFGIYQPLLGWRSKRTMQRVAEGLNTSFSSVLTSMTATLNPSLVMHVGANNHLPRFEEIRPASTEPSTTAYVNANIDSFVARAIVDRINSDGYDLRDDGVWERLVSQDALREILAKAIGDPGLAAEASAFLERNELGTASALTARTMPYNRESIVAGALNALYENKSYPVLREIFAKKAAAVALGTLLEMRRFVDPLESFDPGTDLDRVTLSPIGLVHLYREYFFEFDTFLGSPVQHIWLSPGASVELIEVSTRKTTEERTAETSYQSVIKSENATNDQEELSGAVREENQNNTKLASTVSGGATGGATTPIYSATAHVEASVSYGFDTSTKAAKESAFKNMRQQSTKLSSEITNNYKTTFKTVTETTNTSSRRYVLANGSSELINYELRRKMRQIGVQVQGVGTQLCWQTYVDVPGQHVGLSNLVHIAEPPDYSNLKAPDAVLPPANIEKDLTITLGFQGTGHDNDTNVYYVEDAPGSEFAHPDNGDVNDKIRVNYPDYPAPLVPGFDLADVRLVAVEGNKVAVPEFTSSPPSSFSIHLRAVNYDGDSVKVQVKLVYAPNKDTRDQVEAANKKAMDDFNEEKKHIAQQTLLKEARDRVDAAAKVTPRNVEELREEERILVYRELMKDMLSVGKLPDEPRVRHVLSELINSMFDVDRMLYFVAPDWWQPRQFNFNQQVLTAAPPMSAFPNKVFTRDDIVTWGSVSSDRLQNYFITETSHPAKLGASLGWVMQLDGDNLRNAFLNAPWVKAILPIRPGKELEALNWLNHASVEGTEGLDAQYQAADQSEIDSICQVLESYPWSDVQDQDRYAGFAHKVANDPAFFITIRDAIRQLAIQIKAANAAVMKPQTVIVDGETHKYLPTEKVYEHGFDPLQSAFEVDDPDPFAAFAQWVDIMPTDQVVAVEVKYDPKTGMQL